ncbi:MAG: S9 family peptidase [Sphingomonadales bacterium]|nr:S9 family peptidase [Sphingomonadales bacterium]
MRFPRLPCALLSALFLIANAPAPDYPATRRLDLVERPFGEAVADPYRWLENDVRADPEVAAWVSRENALTQSYLATLPAREWFADRIRHLTDHERFSLPKKAGGRYFYLRNTGLQNQSQLWVQRGLHGAPRLLLDPNAWSTDGATALDADLWQPSRSGRWLAYGVQDGGSDWRTLRFCDARSSRVLPDALRWANDTQLAWVGDEGVLYSHYPAPPPGREFQAPAFGKAVWFHRPGTPQSADELVYATPDHPDWGHVARVTGDGRFAVITTAIGTDARYEIHVVDLAARVLRGWRARPLVSGFTGDWKLVDAIGTRLWFVTNWQAPRYRLVAVDLAAPEPHWQDVVPQGAATLQQAAIVGRRLVLTTLRNAASHALIVDLDGRHPQELLLNEFGTASGFRGRPGDPETFFAYAGFTRPPGIYRYDVRNGRVTPFATPRLGFDPADYRVEQVFYPSKDGTRVPMFLVRRRDIADAHRAVPTLLYGYGGFDIALTPGFVPARMAWLQAGGAFALANLRGGGEFGREWHDAGRLANKQNVFDDFIAAGEWLTANGVTPRGGLAIQGGSNGGLLVGAVVNQRPDLFAAANPQVGVMDMLRFDRFTVGRGWVDDYGHPDVAADWKVLRAYSPYHNIAGGRDYPAILVTTADTDDRVVPGHSFKYAAALQAADIGPRPHLIRVETRAGHGAGKPTDKTIAESADILAFLARWTGLEPRAGAMAAR